MNKSDKSKGKQLERTGGWTESVRGPSSRNNMVLNTRVKTLQEQEGDSHSDVGSSNVSACSETPVRYTNGSAVPVGIGSTDELQNDGEIEAPSPLSTSTPGEADLVVEASPGRTIEWVHSDVGSSSGQNMDSNPSDILSQRIGGSLYSENGSYAQPSSNSQARGALHSDGSVAGGMGSIANPDRDAERPYAAATGGRGNIANQDRDAERRYAAAPVGRLAASEGVHRRGRVDPLRPHDPLLPLPLYDQPIRGGDGQKFPWLPRKKRFYGISISYIILVAVIIALAVKLAKPESPGHDAVSILEVNDSQPKDAQPILGSSLGVAEIILGAYFTRSPDKKPEIKAVYDAGNGRLCIRTRSALGVWTDKIRCVKANPQNSTALTISDWIGGPSCGFINDQGYLSSINYVPKNDTWVLSSLADEKIKPYSGSQLASTTWRSGLAIWFNYQDSSSSFQIKEHGMDDFRNLKWRDSAGGALGPAQEGSSFGISRYEIGKEAYEEIYFLAGNGAIQGKQFINDVWDKQVFSIEGTEEGVPSGASMTATTVVNNNGTSLILLAYVARDGFLTIQTRETGNTTELGAFSQPQKIIQSDARSDIGIAADGSAGIPRIYFFKNQKLIMLESDLDMKNWTTTEVSFS